MFETVKEILVNELKVSPVLITPEATKDDLELDSLALVELAIALEKELCIKIGDNELLDVETVNDIVQLVEQRSRGEK